MYDSSDRENDSSDHEVSVGLEVAQHVEALEPENLEQPVFLPV